MDYSWTAEQETFRARLREVIADALPADWAEKSRYDTSSAYVSKFSRTFCPLLAREKLLIPHWPVALGGGGLDPFHHVLVRSRGPVQPAADPIELALGMDPHAGEFLITEGRGGFVMEGIEAGGVAVGFT